MLKAWHKEDVFKALQARGWMGPALLEYPKDWNCVGFHGTASVESIAGRLIGDSGEYDLWLHRTRDAKWKDSVIKWADQISADRHVDKAPQFKQIP